MKTIEGNLSAAGQKIGIVAARFNEFHYIETSLRS